MKHNHMIEALPPNGTNHSLDVGSLPRGARRGQHFMDTHVSHLSSELIPEDSIAVAEEIAREMFEGKCLPQLLSRPLGGGGGGHIEVKNAQTVLSQHQEHVKDLETDGGHGEDRARRNLEEGESKMRR